MRLIRDSILIALALFIAYSAALRILPARVKFGGRAGSQGEVNTIRAQSYLYSNKTPRVVIVGSSIGARLRDLPPDWFNLCLAGDSAFTGLEMIRRCEKTPQLVLIETNLLTIDADAREIDSLFSPGITQLRRKLPALQETSKPQHLLIRALTSDDKSSAASRLAPSAPAISDQLFAELTKRRLDELTDPLPEKSLDHIVAQLHDDISALRARGIKVILFEMPELPAAMVKPLKTSLRARLQQDFTAPDVPWIPAVDPANYTTTDAVHLTPASAAKYAQVIRASVSNLAVAHGNR